MDKNTGVRNPDGIKARLRELHDTSGLSFREIARNREFSPIPAGTICAIYKGAEVPKKWRKQLGLVELLPAPACPIHNVVHVRATCPGNPPRRPRWVRVLGHSGYAEVRG